MYLDVAETAAAEEGDEARNVAAGNAVLAGIAASDAICCVRLGRKPRGQDHREAVSMLQTVRPEGQRLAGDLSTVLAVKDASHYGETFVSAAKLRTTMRASMVAIAAEPRVHVAGVRRTRAGTPDGCCGSLPAGRAAV